MKGTIKPELILLLAVGLEPKQLIKLGYSEQTVYKYKKHLEVAKQKVREILKWLNLIRNKNWFY